MRMFVFLILLAILPLTTQCGHESDTSELSESAENKPTLVVMGGRTSCGRDSNGNDPSPYAMGMYSRAKEVMDMLYDQAGVKSDYVLSCYGESSTVIFATSSEPNKIARATKEEFSNMLQQNRGASSELFFAGHSYGGWLAMKTSLALNAEDQISGLFTIDPISRVKCSFSKPFGCQSSPTDIKRAQRESINQKTGQWVNFFQTQTWYLHASAIKEADINYEVDAAHREIDTRAGVWSEIYKVIAARY